MNTIRKGSCIAVTECAERARTLAAIGVCCMLIGCVGPAAKKAELTTQVAYKEVDTANGARYELREEENATIPVATQTMPPEYPPAMIAEHLAHVAVWAKVIVDTDGKVGEVRIERTSIDAAHPVAFDDAVRAATSRWRYAPLRIQQWEDVPDREGNVTDSRLVRDDARPFSLDYEFSFDLRDGKPIVAASPASAR